MHINFSIEQQARALVNSSRKAAAIIGQRVKVKHDDVETLFKKMIERLIKKGLSHFNIAGLDVIALNKKNAIRKYNKYARENGLRELKHDKRYE